MAKYFYRFDVSSDLGMKFKRFKYECDKATRAADNYCQKVGAVTFYEQPEMFAGGVLCVSFADPEKVDKKLWRSVGKDTDGYEMWEPNCEQRMDVFLLPRRDFRPCDTATRICHKRVSSWLEVVNLHTQDEWAKIAGVTPTGDKKKDWTKTCGILSKEHFVKYVELYISDEQREQATNKRYKMPMWMRRAIHLEWQRLKLPVVSIQSLYALLQTDFKTDENDDKPKMVQGVTPVFFQMNGYYYIGCEYPCRHQDMEPVTKEKFQMQKNKFEWQIERAQQQKSN